MCIVYRIQIHGINSINPTFKRYRLKHYIDFSVELAIGMEKTVKGVKHVYFIRNIILINLCID